MKTGAKDINFGNIDHFLYVRIQCVCADLGLAAKDFIEQAYFLLVKLITEDGVTQFSVLQDEYEEYEDYRNRSRYSPRMTKEKHSFVVSGIHAEIHEHLVVIKKENNFPWIVMLRILLMVVEANLDKLDAEIWKEAERREAVMEEFRERRTVKSARSGPRNLEYEDGFKIDKTKKRRAYEKAAHKYPEDKNFRMTKE
jgi:tRNA(Ser,Leu) C12 N-acetylase TAN1